MMRYLLLAALAPVLALPSAADKLPADWQPQACEDAFAARLSSTAPEDKAYTDAIGRGEGNDKDLACASLYYAKAFHYGTDGQSVNLDMARRNYQASAARGHPYAATVVGAEINPDRYDYLERGANLGVAVAGLLLGDLYADAYNQDPGFYDFWRAMESYRKTFQDGSGESSIILSPDNEYLRQFRGQR